MKIDRTDTYNDNRFSQEALYQHNCYIIDGDTPVEIKIVSQTEALIKREETCFDGAIEEFRFSAEHITNPYDEGGKLVKRFKGAEVSKPGLDRIQPIWFFIDSDKLEAVKSFVNREEDVIIPVTKRENTYASLDGHTHLYLAYSLGFKYVYACLSETFCGFDYFSDEIRKRSVFAAKDLTLLTHGDYTVKWSKFCDECYVSIECE